MCDLGAGHMTRISSVDFQKNFGKVKRTALAEPVTITVHGKDTLVLMSHARYSEMMAALGPGETGASSLPD